MANIPLKTIKFPKLDNTYTVPQVDNTLSVTGAAADAKKTGDELSELNERLDDEIADVKQDLTEILVPTAPIGTVTLTNIENAQSFYNNASTGSAPNIKRVSYSDGIATFASASYGGQTNPYIRHANEWGTKKWLCGFKYRLTKLDQSLADPEKIRVYLGSSQYYDFNVVWNQWIEFAEIATVDLLRIMLIIANFSAVPPEDSFTCEFKDFYLYDVTDVSSELCDLVIAKQSVNYQDGTVTYGDSDANYVPDTSLSNSGKAADAKAVGDALSEKMDNPETPGTANQVLTSDGQGGQSWESLADIGAVSSSDLHALLVSNATEQVTLTNIENASSFYAGGSSSGTKKISYSDGIATFGANGEDQVSPYIRHTNAWGTKKWLCGFKYRLVKKDENIGDPEKIRIYLGGTDYYDNTDVSWGRWEYFSATDTTDLTRIHIIIANFATAPTSNSFEFEIKDMYLYDASDVSDDMCAYIIGQQMSNYQDGTVTYGDSTVTYVPDTSLSESGKVADAKAVGDAIGIETYNVKKYGVKGDGITDDTVALQSLLSTKRGKFYFPSGTYKINGTLIIPESSEIFGDGDTTIISVYDYTNLDYRYFRGNTKVYPYVLVEHPHVKLHDFKIIGSTPENKNHYGIAVIDTDHCEIKNITAYAINYDPNRQDDDSEYASAYGITALRSEYVTIENCYVEKCGYECIGISDACNYCVVRNCYTQDGWRTCIQVHRGACNTLIDNCYMKQTHNKYHACFTVHGLPDSKVNNLRITNCVAECAQNGTQPYDYCAPYQIMSDAECLVFMGNRAIGGKRAFYITSDSNNAKILGNDFQCNDSSDYGVCVRSVDSILVGNCLVNEASEPVNVIANNPVILGNIGIS